jgi:hypothetical protein
MNLKESPNNVILVVLIVILLGVIGYLLWIKIPALMPPAQQIPPPAQEAPPAQEVPPEAQPTPEPVSVNWENLRPEIERITRPIFVYAGGIGFEVRPISIEPVGDITGDGIPEALVSIGEGRADISILMRIENNKPVIAQFRRDGNLLPRTRTFTTGATAAMAQGVYLLPERNVIYDGEWRGIREGLIDCSTWAYQWNPQTKTFDFNQSLSSEIRIEFCRRMAREMNVEFRQ